MAHVVLITPYYWPEVAASVPLMTSLAEDLTHEGNRVTVLTTRPSSLRGESGARNSGAHSRSGESNGLRVIRVQNPFARKPGVLSKLLEYLWFTIWVFGRLLVQRRVDICFVSSNPPLMPIILAAACRLHKASLIYNVQDLFPDSAVAAGLLRQQSRWVPVLRRLERWSYLCSDVVATISEGFGKHVRQAASDLDVRVIPNWVDTRALHPILDEENEFRKRAGLTDAFVVLYAGNMGFLQDLYTVLQAADRLKMVPDIAFVLVGEGQERKKLESLAARMGLPNCQFHSFLPHDLVAHVFSAGDVGLVPTRPGAAASSIPSKTWAILACGRPVVASVDSDSELARQIRAIGCGLVVECGSSERLANAILDLYRNRSRRERMGQVGRRYVEQVLAREVVTAQYRALVRELSYTRTARSVPAERKR